MSIFRKLNTALEGGLSKDVFDHLRNYLICAFLLAIGTAEFREHSTSLFDISPSQYHGVTVIALSSLLILLNLYDAIRKISNSKYNVALVIMLIALYLFFSFRVIEMAWEFRFV